MATSKSRMVSISDLQSLSPDFTLIRIPVSVHSETNRPYTLISCMPSPLTALFVSQPDKIFQEQ